MPELEARCAPERMCVVCRAKRRKELLARFVARDGAIELDANQRREGRGAYLCLEERRFRAGLSRGLLARRFSRGSRDAKPGVGGARLPDGPWEAVAGQWRRDALATLRRSLDGARRAGVWAASTAPAGRETEADAGRPALAQRGRSQLEGRLQAFRAWEALELPAPRGGRSG